MGKRCVLAQLWPGAQFRITLAYRFLRVGKLLGTKRAESEKIIPFFLRLATADLLAHGWIRSFSRW